MYDDQEFEEMNRVYGEWYPDDEEIGTLERRFENWNYIEVDNLRAKATIFRDLSIDRMVRIS